MNLPMKVVRSAVIALLVLPGCGEESGVCHLEANPEIHFEGSLAFDSQCNPVGEFEFNPNDGEGGDGGVDGGENCDLRSGIGCDD